MYKTLNAPEAPRANKKNNKGGIMVLLVIITAILVGGIVYVWQQASVSNLNSKLAEIKSEAGNKLSELENKVQDLEKQAEEEKPIGEEWQIYTNDKYGFTLEIPDEFVVVDKNNYEIYYKYENLDFRIRVDDKTLDTSKLCNPPDGTCDTWEEISLDGRQAYRLDIADGVGATKSIYYSLSNNQTLVLVFAGSGSDGYEVFYSWDELINKSLDSFKFLLDTDNGDNLFDVTTAKVGDQIAGMTITSVEPFKATRELSYENAKVEFSGETIITGEYYYNNMFKDPCISNIDEDSNLKLPKIDKDTRSTSFCFSDDEWADLAFSSREDGVKITVAIDNYTIISYPSEVVNKAKFVIIK